MTQQGVICDYCDRPAKLVTGDAIYRGRSEFAHLKFWVCSPCKAHVGCHAAGAYMWVDGKKIVSDGTLPLGRLANAELRAAKRRAHEAFDPLWRSRRMTRRGAYEWLARQIGCSVDNCHIGMMDVDACNAVVAAVRLVHQGARA